MHIAVIAPVWVKSSQDPVEGPKDLTACVLPAGEHQGNTTGPSPVQEAAVLRMEKVSQVLTVLWASFSFPFPLLTSGTKTLRQRLLQPFFPSSFLWEDSELLAFPAPSPARPPPPPPPFLMAELDGG